MEESLVLLREFASICINSASSPQGRWTSGADRGHGPQIQKYWTKSLVSLTMLVALAYRERVA